MINIDEFLKCELKVGTVLEAQEVEGSDKLIKLKIDLGEENPRQILSGIKKWYKPERLIGKQVVMIANLEPRMMMGMESQGMILCADSNEHSALYQNTGTDKPVILKPASKVPPGAKIR